MDLSYSEENYLKSIFNLLATNTTAAVGTTELAMQLSVKPASVNEMLKKLKAKKMVDYKKYGKIKLTKAGKTIAVDVVRKHRLWETFLYEKLDFSWDEVHEVAEELEHIQSRKLINSLDKFLNYPRFDPHGDPIPDEFGVIQQQSKKTLSEVAIGATCKMVAVKDNSSSFLQYVISLGLGINNSIKVMSRESFDGQMSIRINGETKTVSQKFSENIYVI